MDQSMVNAPFPAPQPLPSDDDDPKMATTAPPAPVPGCCLGALLTQATNWTGLLVSDHLTSQDRMALFNTCRRARRAVLSAAEQASFRLHASQELTMEELEPVRVAMANRFNLLPTKRTRCRMELITSSEPLIVTTLNNLSPLTSRLEELTVEVQPPDDMGPAGLHVMHGGPVTHVTADTLVTIGGCCPNLRALSLVRTSLRGLPSLEHCPHLEELVVHLPQDHDALECVIRDMTPYIQQLTLLRINGVLPHTLVPLLLSPATMATRLHTLELPFQPLAMGAAPVPAAPEPRFNVRLGNLITEASNWSCPLVTEHLDPGARLALFLTCQGSRGLVLEAAEHATVALRVTQQHLEPRNIGGILATGSVMQARGRLPTNPPLKLHLSTTTAPLMAITLGLMGRLDWLGHLVLEVRPESGGVLGDELPTPVLENVARCCPSLRVLDLRSRSQRLPSPNMFRALRELVVFWPWQWGCDYDHSCMRAEGLARSITPFAPQLTQLGTTGSELPSELLPLLLSAGNVGANLKALRLNATLDDGFLSLLVEHTLALDELQVQGICVRSDAHARSPAPWRLLQLAGNQSHLVLSSLPRLPLAQDMEFVCSCADNESVSITCDISTVEAAAMAAPYKAMRFIAHGNKPQNVVYVRLAAAAGYHDNHGNDDDDSDDDDNDDDDHDDDHVDADQPNALRAGLALLNGWVFAANVSPWLWGLNGWVMTTDLMQELRDLPRWQYLRFGSDLRYPLEAQPYAQLLSLLPDTYQEVTLECVLDGGLMSLDGPSHEQIESICLGAPTNRTAEAPLRIVLDGASDEVIKGIARKMRMPDDPYGCETIPRMSMGELRRYLDRMKQPAEPVPYPHVTIDEL